MTEELNQTDNAATTTVSTYTEELGSLLGHVNTQVREIGSTVKKVKVLISRYPAVKNAAKQAPEALGDLLAERILERLHLPWYVSKSLVRNIIKKSVVKFLEKV